jgi:hypothetical protein
MASDVGARVVAETPARAKQAAKKRIFRILGTWGQKPKQDQESLEWSAVVQRCRMEEKF